MGTESRYLYTLPDLLRQHRGGHGDAIALVDGEERVSYTELLQRAEHFATFLSASGVRKGDRVCILLRRSTQAVVALFATHLAGAVAVIVNDKLKAAQVNHIVSHSGARVLLSETRLLVQLKGLEIGGGKVLNLDTCDRDEHADSFSPDRLIGQDLALIIYTSGSTGFPKGIMLSHANLISGAQTISDYLRLAADDRLISLLPFTFDYGLNQLLSALFVGGTLVIQRSMFPADICSTLEKERITGMAGVPLLWAQLAEDYSPFTKRSFPDLRYLTNTGGVFPPRLVEIFRTAHPQAELFLMYGLTEAFRSTFLPPSEVMKRPTSMGRAIPNVEILVLNENGEECVAGEPGELVHRGANIAMGYWQDPEATARVFRRHPLHQDGGPREIVVYSGDIVKRDEDGYLYFIGRKDQMIKSHGVRVSPEEIEHYLQSSGLVSAVVVFALPKGEVESEVIAAVQTEGLEHWDEDSLRRYCRDHMPEYMIPATFCRMNQFPQTTSGKPDRKAIREAVLGTLRLQ